MSLERLISAGPQGPEDEAFSLALRPAALTEYIGQREIVEKLSITIEAARSRDEALEHVLFYGPPGLGKTTLAHIIAREMGGTMVTTSGPALSRPGDLMGILTNLAERDVLFIDEIHRLPTSVEEFLYPAMEDYRVDFVVDKGAFAKTINVPLKRFTLVGATTRAGLLSSPLRERFGIFHHLDFYPSEDIAAILKRSAGLLKTPLEHEAEMEIASRARGTPRVVNRLLRRVRDFVQVRSDGRITRALASEALDLEGIDVRGLDALDRRYLKTIIEHYRGGPVGVEALGATLSEEVDTLEDVIEPYLLKIGFVNRTRQGRVATAGAYTHLGVRAGGGPQHALFSGERA